MKHPLLSAAARAAEALLCSSFLCVQTLQDMLSASQQDLEGFLTQVYRAIAGAAPLKDKVKLILLNQFLAQTQVLKLAQPLSWQY